MNPAFVPSSIRCIGKGHDFRELTVLQVNSFIFVMEESVMQLSPATNFDTSLQIELGTKAGFIINCESTSKRFIQGEDTSKGLLWSL